MEDESNTSVVEAAPPAEIAPPKKRQSLKPKQAVSEAVAEVSQGNAPRVVRGPRKALEKASAGAASGGSVAKTNAKKSAKGADKTQALKHTPAPVPVLDDIAELLQLEEENARLRKAVAEKLRAENADLRKRLGLT